jgi:hypothetical protein
MHIYLVIKSHVLPIHPSGGGQNIPFFGKQLPKPLYNAVVVAKVFDMLLSRIFSDIYFHSKNNTSMSYEIAEGEYSKKWLIDAHPRGGGVDHMR